MGLDSSKNALFCPLDWGLGHVSRLIPIIVKFKQKSFNIYIACTYKQYLFLKSENIEFTWLPTKSPTIKYTKKGINFLNIITLSIKILTGIVIDKININKLTNDNNFDIIISDNRYGCYNSRVYSIIITHQINIILPKYLKWAQKPIRLIIKLLINRFNEIWIPDVPYFPNFAGELSRYFNKKTYHIGLLSRFNCIKTNDISSNEKYEVLAILSGPEPQLSCFYNILLKQLKELNSKCAIVYGKVEKENSESVDNNVKTFSFANSNKLYSLIQSSKYIIARAGYSTIMDLICLKKTAILVPTPGQTEQEYLANYLSKQKWFVWQKQNSLNLKKALYELNNTVEIPNFEECEYFLEKFLKKYP
jgi:uncharacterized protein (TIGR00661 family)